MAYIRKSLTPGPSFRNLIVALEPPTFRTRLVLQGTVVNLLLAQLDLSKVLASRGNALSILEISRSIEQCERQITCVLYFQILSVTMVQEQERVLATNLGYSTGAELSN